MSHVDARLGAPLAVAAVGSALALVGTATGSAAAYGAVVATAVVLLFFWTGVVPVLVVGADTSRAFLGFLLLGMGYVLRLVAVLVVLAVASASDAVDARWCGASLIALTLVWTTAQVALLGRSRITLDPVPSGPPAGDPNPRDGRPTL